MIFFLYDLAVFSFAIANALYDNHRIDKGLRIHHGLESIVRGIIIILLAITFEESLRGILFGFWIFWFVFEITLNLLRGKNPLYVGTDEDTAQLDKLVQKVSSFINRNFKTKIYAGIYYLVFKLIIALIIILL